MCNDPASRQYVVIISNTSLTPSHMAFSSGLCSTGVRLFSEKQRSLMIAFGFSLNRSLQRCLIRVHSCVVHSMDLDTRVMTSPPKILTRSASFSLPFPACRVGSGPCRVWPSQSSAFKHPPCLFVAWSFMSFYLPWY